MTGLHRASLTEIATASAIDVARSCMAAVVNGESGPARLNAFVSWDYDAAIAQAQRIDDGEVSGVLRGVPVAIKDNICTLGLPTTCASRILADYRSPFEATAVRRLRAAGAIIVGKTNLDEFAMGTSTETSAFGATRNPHDLDRVPGGSSGGSAAAVAAGTVPVALGSDTGGSVRQPAAFCGVVGIRPTYGRVSRYGLVAFASSLDQIGVLARNVTDAAAVLDVIAGPDVFDSTARALDAGHDPDAAFTVGIPAEYFDTDLDDGVRASCVRAIDALRDSGCTVRNVSLPHTPHGLAAYSAITAAEASSNLARFDGVRFGMRASRTHTFDELCSATRGTGFGMEVKRRILLGTHLLAERSDLIDGANRMRAWITHDINAVFSTGIDVLFTPTTRAPAFRAGTTNGLHESDAFTAPASLAGVPAMSIPIGRSGSLPVGGQLIAPRWHDGRMIAAARRLERLLEPT